MSLRASRASRSRLILVSGIEQGRAGGVVDIDPLILATVVDCDTLSSVVTVDSAAVVFDVAGVVVVIIVVEIAAVALSNAPLSDGLPHPAIDTDELRFVEGARRFHHFACR